jgi:hypothetical protein
MLLTKQSSNNNVLQYPPQHCVVYVTGTELYGYFNEGGRWVFRGNWAFDQPDGGIGIDQTVARKQIEYTLNNNEIIECF